MSDSELPVRHGAESSSASAVLKLGCLAFALSVLGGLGISDRRNWDLDASLVALVVVILVYLPVFLGPALALGTLGAAFAEGISKRSSIQGVMLAAAGAAIEWVLWQAGR